MQPSISDLFMAFSTGIPGVDRDGGYTSDSEMLRFTKFQGNKKKRNWWKYTRGATKILIAFMAELSSGMKMTYLSMEGWEKNNVLI